MSGNASQLPRSQTLMRRLLQKWVSLFSPSPLEQSVLRFPESPKGYEECSVELPGEIQYKLVFEAGTRDPVIRSYVDGYKANDYLIELLLRFAPRAGRVLDLGAHIGTFSLAASSLGHDVVAVEAAPIHVDLLQRGAARNGFGGMRVVQAAVGEKSGFAEFYVAGLWGMVANPGCDLQEVAHVPAIKVPAMTGDRLLRGMGWDRVDFIKMDIEGSEVAALRGLKTLLKRKDAPVIVYECNNQTLSQFGYTTGQLVGTLENFGYRSYRVEKGRFRSFRSEDFQPEMYLDIVALKPRHEQLIVDEIGPPFDTEELIASILSEANFAHENYRANIARRLASAPAAIVSDARVQSVLENLVRDSSQTVRDAVGWFNKQGRSAA